MGSALSLSFALSYVYFFACLRSGYIAMTIIARGVLRPCGGDVVSGCVQVLISSD